MKAIVAADLCGSRKAADLLLHLADKEKPDRILLLGNLLSAGPLRRPGDDYDPPYVRSALSGLRPLVIASRGAYDSRADEKALGIRLPDVNEVYLFGRRLILTYGDELETESLPLRDKDVVLVGKSRFPVLTKALGATIVSPGALSARGGKFGMPSYALIMDGEVRLYSAGGTLLKLLSLD